MSYYFLESSALTKLFMQEQGSSALVDLLEGVENNRMLIAAIAPVEVRSAIRRRQRLKDITTADADKAVDELMIYTPLMVSQPIQSRVLDSAGDLTDRHGLRSLDSLQLACSLLARESLATADVVFVCADKQLLQAAALEGLVVLDPT